MKTEPQSEHQWLQQLVGEWSFEAESSMGPDKPPEKFTGKESVRSLGGLWIQCEGTSDHPVCGTAISVMTIGYDPAKKRHVGSYISSMMNFQWLYEGDMDPTGRILTLDAEGPSFTDQGKMAKYKDTIEIKSKDYRTLSSRFQTDDGAWIHFMTVHYRRVK